jgi:hypothetical protein
MVSLVPVVSTAADWKIGLTLSNGAIGAEGAEGAEGSSRLKAVAVNVYEVPFVRPVTAQLPPVELVTVVLGVVVMSQNFEGSSTAETRKLEATFVPPRATVTVTWLLLATKLDMVGASGGAESPL